MKYTVDYFIEFFSSKNEDNWIVGNYHNGLENHCAYGHVMASFADDKDKRLEVTSTLKELFKKYGANIEGVNDWLTAYKHHSSIDMPRDLIEILNTCDSPKERILTTLKYIKEKDQPSITREEVLESFKEDKALKVNKLTLTQ